MAKSAASAKKYTRTRKASVGSNTLTRTQAPKAEPKARTAKKKKEGAPEVSDKEKKAMRAEAHNLKPVVIIGKDNVTPGVIQAVDAALEQHELIKVKLLQSTSVDKSEAAAVLCVETGATLIQRIGGVALLYRRREGDEGDHPRGSKASSEFEDEED
ncbi:MAG: YhbY family RNA-binding protein [Myxococcales bacterium]|nr:YhbY family RNA-binding protein [Myxococcales bacterium]